MKYYVKSSQNDLGIFMHQSDVGLETILKGHVSDIKTKFGTFQVYGLDLNVLKLLSRSLLMEPMHI